MIPPNTAPTSTRRQPESESETSPRYRPTCVECDGTVIYSEDKGEYHCDACGLVLEESNIDRGPEWRAFTERETSQKSRVGAPVTNTLHDKGLSTMIGWRDEDTYGNALSKRQQQKFQRLRTWDERFRTRDGKERNLKQALGEIDRMASALDLPTPIRETASVIYRRALEKDLLRGRSIEGIGASALYAAARQANTPRSLDEVAAVSRIDKSELARTYRYVARELALGIAPDDPTDYLPRFASDCEVSVETETRARHLLEVAAEQDALSGKSPVGLAAAAIYAATRRTEDSLTQADASEVTNVSKVTIRNRYQELLEIADDADPNQLES